MVQLRKRSVRKAYCRKRVYCYERLYLEFPTMFNDLMKEFLGLKLTISAERCAERLVVTLVAPAKAFLSSETAPEKEERSPAALGT